MDVKETLTRWSRAYKEPSLFYVPAKKNKPPIVEVDIIIRFTESFFYENDTVETEVYIMNGYRTSSIVGAIFTTDGKFVEYVSVDSTVGTYDPIYKTKLKQGTYIFKEAISPKGCLLADDITFTVKKSDDIIKIKHKRNGFKVRVTLEKSSHCVLCESPIDDNNISILNANYQTKGTYNVFYNYYSLYDNSLIRKLEINTFYKDYDGTYFYALAKLNYRDKSLRYNSNSTYIYNDSRVSDFHIQQYTDAKNRARYETAHIRYRNNDSYSNNSTNWLYRTSSDIHADTFFINENGLEILVETYWNNSINADLSFQENELMNLTEQKMKDAYIFARDKGIFTSYRKDSEIGDSASIYLFNGQFYTRSEATSEISTSGLIVYVYRIRRKYVIYADSASQKISYNVLFSNNIETNDLYDSIELGNTGNFKYQRYYITDNSTDISKYFNLDIPTNDNLFTFNALGIEVFTKEFINNTLLNEINQYKKDGE